MTPFYDRDPFERSEKMDVDDDLIAHTEQLLDELHQVEQDKKAILDGMLEITNSFIPDDVRKRIQEVEAEFGPAIAQCDAQIIAKNLQIKEYVTAVGKTVRGKHKQAVFTPGKPVWNDKMLEGLALMVPQVKEAKSIGRPSISIRDVSVKE